MKTKALKMLVAIGLLVSSLQIVNAAPKFKFVTTTLPDGTVGSAYSATLETANAVGVVTYSVSTGTLPNGLSLDSASGAISGTPTTAADYNVTFSANDTDTTVELSTTITITGSSSFAFTTTSMPDGTVNSAYSATLETQNAVGSVTFSVSAGALPAGLTLDASTGVVSGTPTATGVSDVTFSANDTSTTVELVTTITISESGSSTGFRFITQSLPDGTTNGEYSAYLLTANAAGTVTYSVVSGTLAPGLSLDAVTGHVSGRPTDASNYEITFGANDGTASIQLAVILKISAAGGGGNAGASFSNTSLPQGRVGTAYTETLTLENGVGPFVFCSEGLPQGVNLDGLTGIISGTPKEAGTFYCTLSVTDKGENDNKVVTTLPMVILPADSDFVFSNRILNNGEVGTAYTDTLSTTGGSGSISYSASGLPDGLSVAKDTGVISGTPTVAGTFATVFNATDSANTISINLSVWIVPSATSSFYWDVFNLPAAIYGVNYDRQPPIYVIAKNGTSVTYSAIGLPSGITYSSTSGELAGVSIDVGVYPVTFTATDSSTSEVIILKKDFLVLPSQGGDAKDLPVNLWVKKQQLKTGVPGKDSWKAMYIYNADRRASNIFDPANDAFQVTLGGKEINLAAGSFTGDKNFQYKTPKESGPPYYNIKVDPKKQVITINTSKDTIEDQVPGEFENTLVLGSRSYKLDEKIDEKGKFNIINGYLNVSFVVDKANIVVKGSTKDTAKFSMLLGDPAFEYEQGDTMQFRVINSSGSEVINKTFTDLVSMKTSEKNGITTYQLKRSEKDTATTNQLSNFKLDTKTGKTQIILKALDISLTGSEEHVAVELIIGNKTYFTSVTLFAPKAGKYSTTKP